METLSDEACTLVGRITKLEKITYANSGMKTDRGMETHTVPSKNLGLRKKGLDLPACPYYGEVGKPGVSVVSQSLNSDSALFLAV